MKMVLDINVEKEKRKEKRKLKNIRNPEDQRNPEEQRNKYSNYYCYKKRNNNLLKCFHNIYFYLLYYNGKFIYQRE